MVRAGIECLPGLEVLLQLGVAYFFEFLRQSVHRHGEDKSEKRLEAFDVAWRHNKIEAHRIFEVLEVVDREVAFFDTALNKWIAVKDERSFGSGQYAGELLVLSVEHFLHFFHDDRMYKRFLAVAEIPIVGGIDVRGAHDLGKVFAGDVGLLIFHSFEVDWHRQIGHQRCE